MNEILLNQDNIIRQQDNQLNTLSTAVGILHSISGNIRDELRSQGTVLSELEGGIDSTQARITGQISRMKKLVKKRKMCKLFLTIIGLFIILGIILYIVLVS
jgi:syntaxin 6